ncbi:MAG TPA: hypothetical protein VE957_16845 [Terriglobales bacterium]|nr:hypothetical protein [Terriglobales bacterium]
MLVLRDEQLQASSAVGEATADSQKLPNPAESSSKEESALQQQVALVPDAESSYRLDPEHLCEFGIR